MSFLSLASPKILPLSVKRSNSYASRILLEQQKCDYMRLVDHTFPRRTSSLVGPSVFEEHSLLRRTSGNNKSKEETLRPHCHLSMTSPTSSSSTSNRAFVFLSPRFPLCPSSLQPRPRRQATPSDDTGIFFHFASLLHLACAACAACAASDLDSFDRFLCQRAAGSRARQHSTSYPCKLVRQ